MIKRKYYNLSIGKTILFALALLLLARAAISEELPSVVLQPLSSEPILYQQNVSIAVSADNQIAVWSGPAVSEGFETAVAVFDENGHYLYGYEIHEHSHNGTRVLRYSKGRLYLFHSKFNSLYEIDPNGAGIVSTQTIPPENTGLFQETISYEVGTSCELLDTKKARLQIRNSARDTLLIYDYSDRYESVFHDFIPFWILAFTGSSIGIIVLIALKNKCKRSA